MVKSVAHAIARDGSSGGCIRTVVISREGVKRRFLPHPQVPQTYGELKQPQLQQPDAAAAAATAVGA